MIVIQFSVSSKMKIISIFANLFCVDKDSLQKFNLKIKIQEPNAIIFMRNQFN